MFDRMIECKICKVYKPLASFNRHWRHAPDHSSPEQPLPPQEWIDEAERKYQAGLILRREALEESELARGRREREEGEEDGEERVYELERTAPIIVDNENGGFMGVDTLDVFEELIEDFPNAGSKNSL